MRSKHCSDEQLLAYLDGELGPLDRYRCARHLRRCWACREQLGAVEKRIRRLTGLAREQQERFSPEAAAAKRRFLASVAFEPNHPADSARTLPWPRLAASLGLGALAFAAGISYWHHTSGSISVEKPQAEAATAARPSQSAAPTHSTVAEALSPAEHLQLEPQRLKRWTPESLAEAELEATSVLCAHASQSLAAFTFERDPVRGLQIEGIVEDQSRKDILLSGFSAAIRSAPWNAHLTVAAELRPPSLPDSVAPQQTVRAGRSPAEEWLRGALPASGEGSLPAHRVNSIVNGALQRVEIASAAALALRRLAERFPEPSVQALSPRGRALLLRLISGQIDGMRTAVSTERQWMATIFHGASRTPTQDIFTAVREWDRLTCRLMTCCDHPPEDAGAELRALASLLAGIDAHLGSGEVVSQLWPGLAKEYGSLSPPAPR